MRRHNSTTDPIPDVLQRVGRIGRLFTRWADSRLNKNGFSVAQLPVLFALKEGVALTQKELALLAQIEQPTMAQLLARMERDGLIERKANPEDQRSSLISLRSNVLQNAVKTRIVLKKASDQALNGLSDREVDLLNDLLGRVVKNLERAVALDAD